MPSVPQPEQPGRTPVPVNQYAARDAACDEWVERVYGHTIPPREMMIAKTAFCAGWSARKHDQYLEIVRRPQKLVDNVAHAMSPLFPTDAELNDGH